MIGDGYSFQQQAGVLAWHLASGVVLSSSRAAALIRERDVRKLLGKLSLVLPLERHADGSWQRFPGPYALPVSPQQRAAVLAWELSQGRQLTVRQAADLVGLQYRATLRVLVHLSCVLPIVDDDRPRDRVWCNMNQGGYLWQEGTST